MFHGVWHVCMPLPFIHTGVMYDKQTALFGTMINVQQKLHLCCMKDSGIQT